MKRRLTPSAVAPPSKSKPRIRSADITSLAPCVKSTSKACLVRKNIDFLGDTFNNPAQRRRALQIIQGREAKISGCNISEILSGGCVLSSDSSSAVVITLGSFPSLRGESEIGVALKFSFESCDPEHDNSQETERYIYSNVVNKLFVNGYTPHVMLKLGEFTCDNFSKLVNNGCRKFNQTDKNLNARLCELRNAELDTACDQKLYVTMLERGMGNTLGSILECTGDANKILSWKDFVLPVLFQIFFTLSCFQEVGLMHNDLHLGNVYVDIMQEPQTTWYQALDAQGKLYTWKVTSRYFVKIYDYDRSAKIATAYNRTEWTNTYLGDARDAGELCYEVGQCNTFSPFFDARSILAAMEPGSNWVDDNIMDNDTKQFTEFMKQLCPIAYENFENSFAITDEGLFSHLWCVNPSNNNCQQQGAAPGHYIYDVLLSAFSDLLVLNGPTRGEQIWRLPSTL